MELLDQPRRQTMSFHDMPAALEADPERRSMSLVLLVYEQEPARSSRCLGADKHGRRWKAASAISAAVDEAFTGLKLTADWTRWFVRRADGVKIERPTYIEDRGTLESVISVDPDTNYDDVYCFVLNVLERQPGYESRGSRRYVFTAVQEAEIERMPTESEGGEVAPLPSPPNQHPSDAAADLLRRL